jgi:hypothetical protein
MARTSGLLPANTVPVTVSVAGSSRTTELPSSGDVDVTDA